MVRADQMTRMIEQQLGVDERALALDALFRDDLGADSLDAFELLMAFEDEFNIDVPDEDAGQMKRVKDAMAYIGSHRTTKR